MTSEIILAIAALFPAIALGAYIYIKDRAEKEPTGLLIALLVGGAISVIPILIVEIIFGAIIESIFGAIANAGLLTSFGYRTYVMTDMMIGVALVEEGFKWLAMWILTSKNKNFNSLFDGIIYAVFVSLGFAGIENLLYVFENGFGNALMRMVTAVPAHMFFGVLMGYYYSNWNIYKKAKIKENELRREGCLSGYKEAFSGKKFLKLSLLMPILAHGFYDYCCSVGTILALLTFVGFLIFLYVYCFIKVHKMSNADTSDMHMVDAILLKKYPELIAYYVPGRTQGKNSMDDLKQELYESGREETSIY